MRARGKSWVLCLAALAGCAVPRLSSTPDETLLAVEVRGPGLLFEVRYPRDDAGEAGRIGGGLLAAGPRLSRWGRFRHGVTVRVLPDHEALEALIGLHGYPWLRAWALCLWGRHPYLPEWRIKDEAASRRRCALQRLWALLGRSDAERSVTIAVDGAARTRRRRGDT